ncbi:MAG: sugar phosphate isomerase/epimerase family protein [Chthoniobacterales bacterium]
MFTSGLVSISFRKISVQKIVELCVEAKLGCIEWGGDVHVPHGDLQMAREARRITVDSGLSVAAYGSYYRLASPENPSWEAVRDSALELGSRSVRVWAGTKSSADYSDEERETAVADARRIAEDAAKNNLRIAWEYHANTLTDSRESTRRLLTEVDAENVFSLWQPAVTFSREERIGSLEDVLPRLLDVHVYHWIQYERFPLSEASEEWSAYFEILKKTKRNRAALLEFVPNDDPSLLVREATALNTLLEKYSA